MVHFLLDPNVMGRMSCRSNAFVYSVVLGIQFSYLYVHIYIIPQSVIPHSMLLQPAANAASPLPNKSGASTLGQSQVRGRTKIEPSLANMSRECRCHGTWSCLPQITVLVNLLIAF